ncbi:hypothetical protein LEP1GSC062_0964 [Leptospira alexanderi serovar Manhao 3 str. L 60]|uniref:Uncharacterized protein n=1 Tax=Leptospira alexanderi serovar Manhao 3 str. L 60 TaxID=1049759 RepID=V6I112_9LEPT|nr:hypothetical protein LEP1GSC062_0964 [Leptospira alexanderi serovar Manhao 3 str. L 60]
MAIVTRSSIENVSGSSKAGIEKKLQVILFNLSLKWKILNLAQTIRVVRTTPLGTDWKRIHKVLEFMPDHLRR